jgi:hypothetical protein
MTFRRLLVGLGLFWATLAVVRVGMWLTVREGIVDYAALPRTTAWPCIQSLDALALTAEQQVERDRESSGRMGSTAAGAADARPFRWVYSPSQPTS